MKEYIFQKIISEICNCRNGGFGYIESFMNILGEYQQDLNISAGVVSWSLQYLGKNFNYRYFVNNNRINLDSFKIDMMALHDGILDSKEVNLKKYKNSSEFASSHIIAIPIHYKKGTEVLIDIHGVVLLISTKTINISPFQIQTIYTLLSNQSPSTLCNPFVCNAINELASDDISIKNLTLKDRHRTLNRALDLLSCKGEDKLRDHGLRHFSFWSVDNDNEMTISKEFNKNTYGDDPHTNTYCYVKDNSHYIYSYAKLLSDKSHNVIDKIRFLDYNEFKSSFKVNDYFNKIGITAERGVLIIAAIDFGTYSSICCFYVRDIIYTPFISITFIQQFVNAIKQRILLVNEINIKNILSRMMSQELSLSNTIDFYRNVVDILKKGNEAKECLIYFRNSRNSRYLLVSEECEEKSSSKKDANFEDGSISFFLPSDYLYDDPFIKSLHKEIINQEHQYFLYEYPQGDIVKSYCLIKIFDERKELYGFVLLLNKKHEIAPKSQGIFFHDTFYYNNVYITNACIRYLLLHRNLEFSNIRRDELLKKYRHEIPNCSHVINNNIKEIEQMLPPLMPAVFKKIRRKSLGIKINCNRIELLAAFFSAIDFDEQQLLNNPRPFDIKDYLNDNIDLFREEASYRGIDLGYSIDETAPILFVSNFYQLSLTNIIKNAIRYVAQGTRIVITRYPQAIEITDIGIPVEYPDRDKIFEDGYRGVNARCVDPNGKGYGLYLSKRIIEAHGHSIGVKSELLSGTNYLAKSALYSAFSKMERSKVDDYLYHSQLAESEISQVSQLLFDLKFAHQHLNNYDKRFVNTDQECLEQWIDYNNQYNYHILDMQDDIFNKQIYKVSFIINTK